jgi:copper chaperone CopZ
MADTERYQMHCQYCQQRFEANTVAEALRKVEEHEVTKHSLLVAAVAKQAEKELNSIKAP